MRKGLLNAVRTLLVDRCVAHLVPLSSKQARVLLLQNAHVLFFLSLPRRGKHCPFTWRTATRAPAESNTAGHSSAFASCDAGLAAAHRAGACSSGAPQGARIYDMAAEVWWPLLYS